jgi:hypothetical protein
MGIAAGLFLFDRIPMDPPLPVSLLSKNFGVKVLTAACCDWSKVDWSKIMGMGDYLHKFLLCKFVDSHSITLLYHMME